MKYILLIVVLSCLACKTDTKQTEVEEEASQIEAPAKNLEAVDLTIYNFNELELLLNVSDDKVHVINFWATWCAPCIKELPHFEKIRTEYDSNTVEIVLVSLDFEQAYETKLKPFILKHNIQSKVVALNDPDSNTWIPKISKTWSGSIPATIIYSKNKRQFYEQTFAYETLKAEINSFLE